MLMFWYTKVLADALGCCWLSGEVDRGARLDRTGGDEEVDDDEEVLAGYVEKLDVVDELDEEERPLKPFAFMVFRSANSISSFLHLSSLATLAFCFLDILPNLTA